MNIELHEISVKDLVENYINSDEEGVVGYNGKLNIRPPYQREFVYKPEQRDKVIDTVMKNFPLNVMYWVKSGDNSFELMDGQQRTISICEYFKCNFPVNFRYFFNLTDTEKEEFLNYKLMVYICEGNDKEKIEWFKTINIAGEKLFDQELLNAMYTGEWLTSAKRFFSKTNCPAYNIGKDYLNGSAIRQDYLETILKWKTDNQIQQYMALHQHDPNANELTLYFQNIISWVKTAFPKYRKEMKGIEWGFLYNKFKDSAIDSKAVEEKITALMQDDDVTNKKGIYEYVLDGEEKHLNIRAFTPNQKREAYERQNGICAVCEKHFEIDEMEGDHITPWHSGGKTTAENCQMLCKDCNRHKSGK
ncbi:HNH endonuclease family protein [Treponema sp.]|uniref:HNH endonuclease family protein n=1 Tax=Treponema sp. TaxID=166 RepID=UPI003EFBC737